MNRPVAAAPVRSTIWIVFRLTVVKSTSRLNVMSIGRLIFHGAPSMTAMFSTPNAPAPPPSELEEPLLLPQPATVSPAARAKPSDSPDYASLGHELW